MSENTSNTVRPAAHGLLLCVVIIAATAASGAPEAEPVSIRQTITAIYIPLADHYAGIVAYEKYRHEMLAGLTADPVVLQATREQNAKDMPLAEIMTIDEQWISGGQVELARDLQDKPAGRVLQQTILSDPDLYTEAFLCDRQGAVVAEYPRTSDYWQGDEEKFTMAYNGGNGQVFVGALEFDESTMSYSIHISYPVMDQGDTIGVLVLGIRNIE